MIDLTDHITSTEVKFGPIPVQRCPLYFIKLNDFGFNFDHNF